MKQFLLFVFLIGLSFGLLESKTDNKLTLNLYYETLCPDCSQFISEQLCPVWGKLGDYFKIDFVPYGNAETNVSKTGSIIIECQHGEEECEANRIQSCALKYLSYEQSTKFICCMEISESTETAGPKCAQELAIEYDPIKKCADGPEGNQLHYQNGVETSKLQPEQEYVPWILFNKVYNKEDMEHATGDLLPILCKYLTDPKPRQCNEVA